MVLCIDIQSVTIVTGCGMDKVYLHTGEDSPCPLVSQQSLTLDFEVKAGDGFRYVTEVLRVTDELVEVINV